MYRAANVFIKVRDNQNICRKDTSNSANTINAATPILTSPNGGEVWKVNSTQNITWTPSTLHTAVFIEYSTDNGTSWNIVVASTPNTGTYSWTIPNTVTTQARIRISNVGFPSNNDVSNAVFTINLPTPMLTSPNGGETFRSQNVHNITWDASTVASNVKLEYSLNNGSTWSNIITSTTNSGTYAWSVPQTVTTTQALVRITNISFPSAVDTSNAVFTIVAPVTVDNPNTGTTLTNCSTVNITWSRTESFYNYNNQDSPTSYRNSYELYYNVDGGPHNLITTVYNSQSQTSYSYNWTVPDITGNIKIIIVAKRNTYLYGSPPPTYWTDSSDVASPTQSPSGTITVTNPNGGVTLNALTPYNITWTASGTSGYFDVQYSTTGSTGSYSTLTSNISGNSYTWNVNNVPSTNVFIKVRDNQNICRKDTSNSANTINAATPILTSPNGGEVWKVNSTQNITWTPSTLHTAVFIEYSTDNGTSWNIVVASTPNTGTYSWTIPNTVTTQARIRISNVGFPSNNDVSNAVFTINLPTPMLTSPNGGETFRSQNVHNITWDASTVASNVKLEYSLNNGSTWSNIITSTTNSGTYAWSVPQTVTTTQALVRITNISFPSAVDTSNAVFTIVAPVTVDNPNTGTTLTNCSTVNITWSRTESFYNYNNQDSPTSYRNSYELYYNVDGGPHNLITTVYNSQSQTSYSYNWTVPDITGNIKIIIVAKRNTYLYGSPPPTYWTDSSDVASPTQSPSGTITVTNPNGGVTLNALTPYNITWTASGTSGYFDVQYSTTGSTGSYSTLTSNISGNSYTWNVNNVPSTNVFIKVRDNQNICRKDTSNSANTINAATPILTSPNGGEVWKVNSTQNITWTPSTLHTAVFIEYSTDNGTSWNIVVASTPNTGTYSWTIPNTVTTQARIRISNVGFPSNNDVSNAVFTINLPTPMLTSPNGGETFRSQNVHNITWDASTVASNVKLEYSLNNGSTWSNIITSTTNSGTYAWSVPQTVTTTQALVRITNISFPSAVDTSNAVFTIVAPVTVDNPNTGTTLTNCSTVNITWSRTESFYNYNNQDSPTSYRNSYELYYNVDGGPHNLITTVYNSQSQTSYSYNWTVPDITGNIKIIIVAKRNTYLYGSPPPTYWTDSSDVASPTQSPSGTITVTNPNGGVTLNALTPYNITWTASGTSGYFDVQYSTTGSTGSYSTLTSNISGNSYTWNVNNVPSTNVFIKVRDNQNICRKDTSNSANTINAATPILTSPNGGEVWKVNSTQNITWTPSTLHTAVFIEYSTDNGTSWNIVVASTPNTGTYSWTIPNTVTTQARIRISNVGFPSNNDVSNSAFTINLPTPMLTSPNGGETFRSMNVHNITWDASTVASNVKLEYSLNNGSTWSNIITSTTNSGTYAWSVPQTVTTTQALVRITNTSFPSAVDTSNAVFTIVAPVTVDNPNIGTTLTNCSTINITWSKTVSFYNYNNQDSPTSYRNSYELYYNIDGGPHIYITSVYNSVSTSSYSYNWTVPDVTGNIKVIVVAKWNTFQYGSPPPTFWTDSSDVASPTQSPSGTITVTNPNGGVILNALSPYNITWTASGTSGYFDVQYSTTGSTGSYGTLASNISGNSYTWNVNNVPSTNVFIKVRDNQNICRKDTSNSSNTIVAATPILISPNGGEVWNVASSKTITWNSSTLFSPVQIEYSTDNGATWNYVVTSTTNNGSYTWNVPFTPTNQARVRISNTGNTTFNDMSDNPFTIQIPAPVATAPNGGETWYAGTTQYITWQTSTFFSNTVNIEYSLDGGNTWNTIANNQSNNGSYTWTIPNVNSANALVKVSNSTHPAYFDISDALFTLRPYVRLITPNGGNQLGSCTQTTITFEKAPLYTSFNIEYSIDAGNTWVPIITNQTFNNTFNNYNWTIPNTPTAQALVRVYPNGVVARADQSDDVFTIKKAVTIIQPNYGGVLVVGSTYQVKWQSDGISNVYDIAYSTTGPTGPWTNIILGYNTPVNTYNWTVPNAPSTNCYLRIRDNINSCKEDISDLAFSISSSVNPITVTAPNGGDSLNACQIYNIAWTETGTPAGNYNISYSIDYGVNWIPIATNYITTNGFYPWIIPNISSATTLVRVQNANNPTIFDFSNALFTIVSGRLYASNDVTICAGETVQLFVTGGTSYVWSPSSGLNNAVIPNPVATPVNSTQYIVSSVVNGCTLTDTVNIEINPNSGLTAGINIVASATQPVCGGTPVTFTADFTNSGATPVFQWKVNGMNVGSNAYVYTTSSLSSSDVVTCVMTSSIQCAANNPAVSNPLSIVVHPLPLAPLASSNSPVSLNGTLELYASTVPNATYSWSGPNGFSSTNQNPQIFNANPSMSGIYTVYATSNGCSGSAGSTNVYVDPNPAIVNVEGSVISKTGQIIKNATLYLGGFSQDTVIAGISGDYVFQVQQGESYTITPWKNNDQNILNGISTLDIVLMQRHILNVQPFQSPYTIIAADVDGSQTVTNMDMILTKALILQNISNYPGNAVWNFVNSDYVFANPQIPFPFETARAYSSVQQLSAQDFIGVKLGDVNDSWNPNYAKALSENSLSIFMPQVHANQFDTILVPVSVIDFNNISGFQYTIEWDPTVLQFIGAENQHLSFSFGQTFLSQGKMAGLWSTENLNGLSLPDSSTVLELKFFVTGQNGTFSPIQFNSSVTNLEAYDHELKELNILVTNGSIHSGLLTSEETMSEYLIHFNCYPNPFSDFTVISFSINQAQFVNIEVFDVYGKKVNDLSGYYHAGQNKIEWDGSGTGGDKLSNGAYFCRIQTAGSSGTRKIVLMK
jgi:hypothetical protein